jgi:hypothetical protein
MEFDLDEFDGPSKNKPQVDSTVSRFYSRLADLYTTWIPVEDCFYRSSKVGNFDFDALPDFKEWPDLTSMRITHAKNGGPIGKFSYSLIFKC